MIYHSKCIICNKGITTSHPHTKCCSLECSIIHRKNNYKKRYNKTWIPIKIKCKLCNKSFMKNNKQHIYCSKECRSKVSKKNYEEKSKGIIKYKNSKRTNFLRLRFKVFQRDNFTCQYCGRSIKDGIKLHVDHKNPVSNGGVDTAANLLTSCEDCNLGKGDVLLEKREEYR